MASIFTLDLGGVLLAIIFGVATFYFGLQLWWFFIALLIDFLVLSSIVTKAREQEKTGIRGYGKIRGWKNVVANGLVPVIVVLAYFIYINFIGISPIHETYVVFSFIAAVSAITADKFASELGVFGPQPVDILTRRKVRKGTSGGVTWVGSLFGLIGAALIAANAFALGASIYIFAIIIISGAIGNIIDSIFGHFEEKGIGNKYTSNILCSIAGAISCALLLLYIMPYL
jgi:uncharacterized protein (TIGR00297 family)